MTIAISALSAMGAASLSLASNCPTSISPATAECLSNNADAAFQQNYMNDYINQKSNSGSSYSSGSGISQDNSNTNYSAPAPSNQTQTQQATQSTNTNNNTNDNTSTHKPFSWY